MPRRPFRRARRFRRRRARRPQIGYGQIASKVWRDVKYLKSLINVEFKRYDTDSGYIVPVLPAAATPSHLTTIAQGDGVSSRDGNSIRLKSLFMRFNFYRALNSGPATPRAMTLFRVILVQSIYNNNALPATSDILQNTAVFRSPINADESTGYRVLHDKIYQVTSDSPSFNTKWYLKLNHHCKWSGTTSAITDATSGHLFLFYFVDDTTNGDAFTVNTRLRFIDN